MPRSRPPVPLPLSPSRRLLAVLLATAAGTGLTIGALVARADPGDPPGTIRTVAGMTRNYSQGGFSGDGGKASDAQLYNPRAVAFGRAGDVFIADALNHRVRRIDSNGVITTIAGNPTQSSNGAAVGAFSGDGGPATQAQLNQPHGVAVDSHGNVYVADSLNNRIRRISAANGVITTIAGGDEKHGQPDGPAATAILKFPKSMFMTPDDVLYVCNSGGNEIIKIDLKAQALMVTRVAGNSQSKSYGGDGGFATDAQLHHPQGVWATPNRTVYIADSENNLVRRVTPDGKISTIAGDTAAAARAAASNQYPIPGSSDGDGGPATNAHLNVPRGIAVDDAGNIYVAEEAGARIRRIDPSGVITTIAGNGQAKPQGHNPRIAGDPGPAPAMEAQFDTLHDLNLDGKGDLWIADSKNNRVRVVTDPAHAPAGTPGGGSSQPPPPQQQQPPPQPPPTTTTSTEPPDATTTTTAPQTTTTTGQSGGAGPAPNGPRKSPGPTTTTTSTSSKPTKAAQKQQGQRHH
jgi:sugar lactone lactonase YvrE